VFLTEGNLSTLRLPSTSGVETPDYRMFRTAKTVGQVPVPGRKVACNELPDKNHVTFIKVKEFETKDSGPVELLLIDANRGLGGVTCVLFRS
jgi:hypothetical protein